MIKKLILPLCLVFIFFGCKKEAGVAGLFIGKWNLNAYLYKDDKGKEARDEVNDCEKKSFMEFKAGGAYHEEEYYIGMKICEHQVWGLNRYQYDAGSKKISMSGDNEHPKVFRVISISKNKMVLQQLSEDGTEFDDKKEYIK